MLRKLEYLSAITEINRFNTQGRSRLCYLPMDSGSERDQGSPVRTTTTTTSTSSPSSPPSSPSRSSTPINASQAVKKRQRIACDNCRQRKSKCDGALPCGYCKEKGISCRYAEPTRRGPISKKECNNGTCYVIIIFVCIVIDAFQDCPFLCSPNIRYIASLAHFSSLKH